MDRIYRSVLRAAGAALLMFGLSGEARAEGYVDLAEVADQLRSTLDAHDGTLRARVLELQRAREAGTLDEARDQAAVLDQVLVLLAGATAARDGEEERCNGVPVAALVALADLTARNRVRWAWLEGIDHPAADAERSAIAANGRLVAAALDHLALRPSSPHTPRFSGLLSAGGLAYETQRLLDQVGGGHPGLAASVARLDRGADPATALRLGGLDAAISRVESDFGVTREQALTASTSLGWLDPDQERTLALRVETGIWIARSDSVGADWRGEAVLLTSDALALLEHLGRAPRHHGRRQIPLLSAALGTSLQCAALDGSLALQEWAHAAPPGADSASAAEAADRLARWTSDPDPHTAAVHDVQGLARADDEALDAVLCVVASRPDVAASTPAALALAERAFLVRDDKDLAYRATQTAIRNAAWQGRQGGEPATGWWTGRFGELLVPFLQPGWGPSPREEAAGLARWARDRATDWLARGATDPVPGLAA